MLDAILQLTVAIVTQPLFPWMFNLADSHRVEVEVEYFLALVPCYCQMDDFPSDKGDDRDIYRNFDSNDAQWVKDKSASPTTMSRRWSIS